MICLFETRHNMICQLCRCCTPKTITHLCKDYPFSQVAWGHMTGWTGETIPSPTIASTPMGFRIGGSLWLPLYPRMLSVVKVGDGSTRYEISGRIATTASLTRSFSPTSKWPLWPWSTLNNGTRLLLAQDKARGLVSLEPVLILFMVFR